MNGTKTHYGNYLKLGNVKGMNNFKNLEQILHFVHRAANYTLHTIKSVYNGTEHHWFFFFFNAV